MDDTAKQMIVDMVLAVLADAIPDAQCRPMYGGSVFEMQAGKPKSRIGGVFVSAEHVSLEFTQGAALHDPLGVLEGTGKVRRHVKLRHVDDVTAKCCAKFLRQAATLVG